MYVRVYVCTQVDWIPAGVNSFVPMYAIWVLLFKELITSLLSAQNESQRKILPERGSTFLNPSILEAGGSFGFKASLLCRAQDSHIIEIAYLKKKIPRTRNQAGLIF